MKACTLLTLGFTLDMTATLDREVQNDAVFIEGTRTAFAALEQGVPLSTAANCASSLNSTSQQAPIGLGTNTATTVGARV
jgi:hypothetical protein